MGIGKKERGILSRILVGFLFRHACMLGISMVSRNWSRNTDWVIRPIPIVDAQDKSDYKNADN
jgi:hypothetical protein